MNNMMRRIWSRLLTLVLLCVVTVSFAACSLFTNNLDKKYSTTVMVATVGDTAITVSKKELYDVFMQWGYQYANQMEQEELLTTLTEYVLNNKILKQFSIEKFGELYDSEKAQALKSAYDALDATLRQYVYEAVGQDDPENATTDSENTTTDPETTGDTNTPVEYEPYAKTILVESNAGQTIYRLNLESYADNAEPLSYPDFVNPDGSVIGYTPQVPGVATPKIAQQAMSKIVRNLKTVESGFTKLPNSTTYLNTKSSLINFLPLDEQYVLNREVTRLVDNYETSILVGRLNTAYNLGLSDARGWQDYLNRAQDFELWQEAMNADVTAWDTDSLYQAGGGRTIAEGRANSVIDYYQDKVVSAILAYELSDDDNYEATVMGTSLENLYYVPQKIANNLFTVSHILVGFTDEQKQQYKDIQAESTSNPSYEVTEALEALYAATSSNGKSVYDIYNEVKAALNQADSLSEKYALFRDFIYQYNTDPGMQNPQYEYLMSLNKENNSMIESFTDASIALKKMGQKGKGAISDIVWGEYGAHIIMYTRDVGEFIWTGDQSMLARDYGKTLFATQTAYGNKTKFDTLAEYFTRSYSNYEAALLREFKHDNEVTIVTSALKKFI